MKKIMLSLGLMLGALTLTNCSNEIDENINTNTDGVAFELTAAIEANRVETDGYSTAWAAGDAINLHYAVAGDETTYIDNGKFVITEEDLANGRFTGTLSVALNAGTSYDWFAFYPYSSHITNPTGSSYYRLWQQTQSVLCDDMSHLTSDASGSWSNAPLYGVATAVEAGEPVAITMKQLGTMLRFNIGNSSSEEIVVKSVRFATTSQRITGSYKVNYTGEAPVVTKSNDTYTYFDVTLNVQDELLIEAGAEPGDASQIFAAVAPFTAPAGEVLTISVTTDKGVYETTKTLSAATEFKAGVVNTINVTVEDMGVGSALPFEDDFAWAENNTTSDSSTAYTTTTVDSNYIGVSSVYAAANGGALKFGTGSKIGYITTKTLDLSSAFTVVLTAKQYNDSNKKINVVVGTQTQTVTLTADYNDYYLYFDAASKSSSVQLTTVATTYRAYVDNLQVLSGRVEPEARIVTTTGAASNFGSDTGTTATLNGSYEVLNTGASDVITTGFDYKLSEETDWTTVNAEATTPFSYDLTSLAVDCEYTFRAWATINGGEKVYGAEVVFTPVKLGAMVASDATLSLMFADGTWDDSWGSSYIAHTVDFENIGSVVFASANKQQSGNTIDDCPVTKGKTIELKMSGTNTLNSVTFNLKQWGTKTQTATLHTSTDGGTSYTQTSTTSSTFVLTATSLPEGCNAVKVAFSSSNQVGLQNIVINYNHED